MAFPGEDGRPRRTTGVLGALGLDDADAVMPHERTLPKAKSDRLELLRATRANLDPIWGLSLAQGVTELLEPDGPPFAHAIDNDGVRHELWRVSDRARIDAITRRCRAHGWCSPTDTTGSRLRAPTGRSAPTPASTTRGAGAIMTLVVELTADQLCVRAIHRILNGTAGIDLRAALGGPFRVDDVGPNRPEAVAALEATMAAKAASAWSTATDWRCCDPSRSSIGRMADELPACSATSTRPASTPACSRRCRA